jgi:hypothetical protein
MFVLLAQAVPSSCDTGCSKLQWHRLFQVLALCFFLSFNFEVMYPGFQGEIFLVLALKEFKSKWVS